MMAAPPDSNGLQMKAKRSANPWSSHFAAPPGLQARPQKRPAQPAGQDEDDSDLPPRVVSDVPLPPYALGTRKMAFNTNIMQAQKDWEKQKAASVSARVANGFVPKNSSHPEDIQFVKRRKTVHSPTNATSELSGNSTPTSARGTHKPRAEDSDPMPSTTRASAARLSTKESTEQQYARLSSQKPGPSPHSSASPSSLQPTTTPSGTTAKGAMNPVRETAKASKDRIKALFAMQPTFTDSESTDSDNSTADGGVQAYESASAIETAPDGRPYNQYIDTDGQPVLCNGCVFPLSYQPHEPDIQGYICPVRECRRVLDGTKGLTGHLRAAHCKAAFNDNLDGTMSKVGVYANPGGRAPPIIVSQNKLPPGAPPPAKPGLSSWYNRRSLESNKASPVPVAASTSATDTVLPAGSPDLGDSPEPNPTDAVGASTMYLNQFLDPDQVVPIREDIQSMAILKPRRELPISWISKHSSTILSPVDYACALAYITGKRALYEECRQHCNTPTAHLSATCIALPDELSAAAKFAFSKVPTCVGCRYWSNLQGQNNDCEWSRNADSGPEAEGPAKPFPRRTDMTHQWEEQRNAGLKGKKRHKVTTGTDLTASSAPPVLEQRLSVSGGSTQSVNNIDEKTTTSPAPPHWMATERRPFEEAERFKRDSKRKRKEESKRKKEAMANDTSRNEGSDSTSRLSLPQPLKLHAGAPQGMPLQTNNSQAVTAPSDPPQDEDLEMENWEVAPGRVVEDESDIGFSGPFLRASEPVLVAENTGCNIIVLNAGESKTWLADHTKLQVVFVSAGKVRVTMNSTTAEYGQDSTVVITPGLKCKMENRRYSQAKLFCVTQNDFDLRP